LGGNGHGVPVGIDDLNLYGTTLSIDNALVSAARGTDRYLDLVRIKRRSIAPPFEDPVTLAVNAALPLVEAAGRDAFELLIVATESGFDFGKPLSSYVHRHLGLATRCRNLEVKHACYGGTAALQLAVAWLRAGTAPGRKALVVTTDLPGNQFGEPAELTPGTGAVALSLSTEPRVLALDDAAGYAALEVYDTARPTATGHWVDEVLSLGAYLDLLEESYAHFRDQVPASSLDQDLDHLVYHMPLESLIRKAHGVLLEAHGDEPDGDAVARSFERMVQPSLSYCSETGNIFSGTLYAGLASLVDSGPRPRARVGLYSYGSGSCGEFFAGTLGQDARATVGAHGIASHLGARRALTLEQYERIVRDREAIAGVAEWTPARDLPEGHYEEAYAGRHRLVLDSVKDFYRRYAWS
jgi:3-hydroxy-3-methylglutaryl CoA synthase